MTREEAIKTLYEYRHCLWDKLYEPICMAIKALEQQDKLQHALDMEKGAYNALVKNIQCEDAISRQAVLDLAKKGVLVSNGNYESVCKAINELPSVNPQEQIGHWDSRTCKCSECGYQIAFSEYAERKYKYCPNCGARMVEPQERANDRPKK